MLKVWKIFMIGRNGSPCILGRAAALAVAVAVFLGPWAEALAASASDWLHHEYVKTRLIAATAGVGPSGEVRLGLQVELAPGWDTYWRTPGESGVPTQLDWSESVNLAEAIVEWPLPRRLRAYDVETFVYTGEVVIPITVRSENPNQPLAVNLRVDYGVCKDICIPLTDEHNFILFSRGGEMAETPHAAKIAFHAMRVPRQGPSPHLAIGRVALKPYGGKTVLEITANAALPLRHPDAFIEGPRPYVFGTPEVMFGRDNRHAILHFPIRGGAPETLAGQDIRITLFDGAGRAIETSVTIEADMASN